MPSLENTVGVNTQIAERDAISDRSDEAVAQPIATTRGSNKKGSNKPFVVVTNKYQDFREHLRDPLYRNGYALMANTAITASLGMLYWMLAAHAYDKSTVGRSSAQISAMTLISALTQMNFTSVLMRFVPTAGQQARRLILSCYAIAAFFAAVVSLIVVMSTNIFASENAVLHSSSVFAIWFVIATTSWSVFNLQDGTMTGLRQAIWVPVENGIFGITKIALLFAFVPVFDSKGIFASWTIPVLVSLIPMNWVIFKKFVPQLMSTTTQTELITRRKIAGYVGGDYVSSLFGQAMTTFMPILVVSVLNPEVTAYFFIAQMMSLSIDLVGFNLGSSLVVEASRQPERLPELALGVLRRTYLLTIPLGAVLIITAPWLLTLFGREYSDNATTLLRLLVLTSLPKAITSVHGALARITHNTNRNAIFSFVQSILLIGGSIVFMQVWGIVGVGVAALLSQIMVAVFALPWILRTLKGTPAQI